MFNWFTLIRWLESKLFLSFKDLYIIKGRISKSFNFKLISIIKYNI